MLGSIATTSTGTTSVTLADRVREALGELDARGVSTDGVWARSAAQHVLLGLPEQEAFARLTPLGGSLFGLSFRVAGAREGRKSSWEPMLLVDELVDVVEHAIVAIEAVPIQ